MSDLTPERWAEFAIATQCKVCGGRGGWYEPDEGTWVSCVACSGTGRQDLTEDATHAN
jgi:DnaJ-class molecular chaperone